MRVLFSQGLIAISKPRCGSTSVRRMLDKLVDPEKGDIAVDVAGQRPPFHPHLTAPVLKQLLVEQGFNIEGMTSFILTRHPVDMLWSYFNYFKPDLFGRYNYNSDWNEDQPTDFDAWIRSGRVGMHPVALAFAPDWVSISDLTPLSLEAHTDTRDGKCEVDMIFKVEEIGRFVEWLNDRTGRLLEVRNLNSSGSSAAPPMSDDLLTRLRTMFPIETQMYGV